MSEEVNPGTPESDATTEADEARDSAVETQEGGEGDQKERTDWKALYLQAKGKIEEANTTQAKLKEIEERLSQQTATDNRIGALQGQEQQRLAQIQRDIQQLQFKSQEDSPEGAAARIALQSLTYQEQQQRTTLAEIRFAKISDDALEAEARKEWATGMYASPEAAIKAAKGTMLERKSADLTRQEQALDAERKAKENGRVSTGTRGLSARETSDMLTPAAYLQKLAAAQEKGDEAEVKRLKILERTGKLIYNR